MKLIRVTLDIRTDMDPAVLFHRIQRELEAQDRRGSWIQIVEGSAEAVNGPLLGDLAHAG